MKNRYTSFDILCAIKEINEKIKGSRLLNVYDIDNKTFLLRFGNTQTESKAVLLIESGIRLHLTSFDWPKNAAPSGFSMKLRKHVKSRRLHSVTQLGTDRIVDIQFGDDDTDQQQAAGEGAVRRHHAFHLIVELYDRGNLLLTDHAHLILHVLRARTDQETEARFAAHNAYPVHQAKRLDYRHLGCGGEEKEGGDSELARFCRNVILNAHNKQHPIKSGDTLRKIVSPYFAYGPSILEHCCAQIGLTMSLKLGRDLCVDEAAGGGEAKIEDKEEVRSIRYKNPASDLVQDLCRLLRYADEFVDNTVNSYLPTTASTTSSAKQNQSASRVGYILYKSDQPITGVSAGDESNSLVTPFSRALLDNTTTDNNEESQADQLNLNYLEYHPVLLEQMKNRTVFQFDSFNEAIDEFYSKLEVQRAESKQKQQEKSALKKLENFQSDHNKRIAELEANQGVFCMKGELINQNQEIINKAIMTINTLLANQLDWEDITAMLARAKKEEDEVAQIIHKLQLDKNQISVVLCEDDELVEDENEENSEEEEEEQEEKNKRRDAETQKAQSNTHIIELDLGINAFSNAKRYFDMKRTATLKQEKTIQASKKALKSAEAKTKIMLKDVATIASINKIRKTFWFEKFIWFISSENYLVVGGRDRQQNEMLVKKYLRPGDVFVHADLHGASTIIVRNQNAAAPPPPADDSPPSGEGGASGTVVHRTPPAKTLYEAGIMAVVNSSAWNSRVISSAWWVRHDQVSKTAPSGEYLTTGSFMIRGRKNYLTVTQLVYGFGIMFRLDEESAQRHAVERRVKNLEEEDEICQRNLGMLEMMRDEEEPEQLQKVEAAEEGDATDSKNQKRGAPTEYSIIDRTFHENYPEKKQISKQKSQPALSVETAGQSQPVFAAVSAAAVQPISAPNKFLPPPKLSAEIAAQKRGQKSRHKKQKEKYADQDDNERAIRMALQKGAPTGSELGGAAAPLSSIATSATFNNNIGKSSKKMSNTQKKKQKRAEREQRRVDTLQYISFHHEEMERLEMREMAEREEKRAEVQAETEENSEESEEKQEKLQQQSEAEEEEMENNREANKEEEDEQVVEKDLEVEEEAEDEEDDKEEEETAGQVEDEANNDNDGEYEEEEEVNESSGSALADLEVMNSLTGMPRDDDAILYAVPVCAPYSTLAEYKFKVKLLPGQAKKGKAIKSVLLHFQQDKTITTHEKDLIRVLKDQDVSRNLPGKIKLSLPNTLRSHLNKK